MLQEISNNSHFYRAIQMLAKYRTEYEEDVCAQLLTSFGDFLEQEQKLLDRYKFSMTNDFIGTTIKE